MDTKILKKSDYKITNWSGGTTTEILIYPKGSTLENRDFIFRVSSATCEDGKNIFSDFTGYNRYITSLDNDLYLENQGNDLVLKPYEIFSFDGEHVTASKSAVTDFNLIIKKGFTGSLRSESFEDKIQLKIFGGYNLIFIPEGNILMTIDGKTTELEASDTIVAFDEEMILETVEKRRTKILIIEAEVD